MPRVMFTISYTIKADRRKDYLELISQLKSHLVHDGKKNYTVYEAKGKKNSFTEVFLTNSLEEFDALDEGQDEATEQLVSRIEDLVDEGCKKYNTMIETE